MTGWLYALGGVLAGIAQAGLLGRSARGVPSPSAFFLRLALVGGVLYLAARTGHLPLGAAGWLLGFSAGVAMVYRRLR